MNLQGHFGKKCTQNGMPTPRFENPLLEKDSVMKFCKFLAVLLVLVTLVSLVACNKTPADTTTESKPADTTAPDKPVDPEIKVEVPDDLNFSDRADNTVVFFVRSNGDIFKNEICSEDTKDTLYKAIHDRNIDVETRLGVTIKQIEQPGSETTSAEWRAWNETLSTSVLTNTGDYDAAAVHSYCGAVLTFENIFADLTMLGEDDGGYLDLAKPWWNQNSIDALAVEGSLYMVGGSMLITETARAYALLFNKDLFDLKFPEEDYANLYTMVNNETWTVDKLIGYVSKVWDDVNSSGEKDDGDIIGFAWETSPTVNTWCYALGLTPVERSQYGQLSLSYHNDPNIIPAFEYVQKLYSPEAEGVMGGTKWKETSLQAGTQLFSVAYIEKGQDMRNTNINYGVLPLPMFDEEQGYYRTNTVGHVSMLTVCSNLPDDRVPMVTATIELMAAESYENVIPAYYSKVLHGVYSKEEQDANMYDMILDSITFDFAGCYFPKSGTVLKDYMGLWGQAKTPGSEIATILDANRTAWETAFETMLDQFAEIGQ